MTLEQPQHSNNVCDDKSNFWQEKFIRWYNMYTVHTAHSKEALYASQLRVVSFFN